MFNPNAAPEQNFERELIPQGPHAARCARIIEIGKQYSPKFDSESDKVVIVLSLPHVMINMGGEEKQAFISNPFGITKSTNEKSSMRQYVRALDPKGEATKLGDLLGNACQVYVGHRTRNDKTYHYIDSIAPLLPGLEVPELDTEPFWLSWDNPSVDTLRTVPEFQRGLIKQAVNYPGSYMEEAMMELEGSVPTKDNDGIEV